MASTTSRTTFQPDPHWPKGIAEFEPEIGTRLPPSYLDLLRFRNGGSPFCSIVVPVASELEPYLNLQVLYFLNSDKNDLSGVWSNYLRLRAVLPWGCFPFGHDFSGSPFVMDARDQEGSVWYRDIYSENGMSLVADSFEGFVDALLPYTDLPKVSPLFELGEDGMPRLKE